MSHTDLVSSQLRSNCREAASGLREARARGDRGYVCPRARARARDKDTNKACDGYFLACGVQKARFFCDTSWHIVRTPCSSSSRPLDFSTGARAQDKDKAAAEAKRKEDGLTKRKDQTNQAAACMMDCVFLCHCNIILQRTVLYCTVP